MLENGKSLVLVKIMKKLMTITITRKGKNKCFPNGVLVIFDNYGTLA